MEQVVSIKEARDSLEALVDRVREQGDTVVLMESGEPAAALIPYTLLEKWRQNHTDIFSVIDRIRARNRDLEMNEEELTSFINEAIHELRRLDHTRD